jgi:acetate CoA/acetoacetate CoA-transferase alpha subunit
MSTPGKRITYADLRPHFRDGMTIMFGGFMAIGTPEGIVRELLASGVKDLTIIGNDTGAGGAGMGVLVDQRRVRKVIATHIGLHPETGRQMMAGDMEVELVPQGTLAERIRCGGAGLGGVLTPTGVGTIVEEGKLKMTFDGIDYLLERPLRADLAILKAYRTDTKGNLVYQRSARNFNPMMAMAADFVVAEVDELVEAGELDPEMVATPGVLVDALILAQEK